MKHQTLDKLQVIAKVDQDYPSQALSRSERLERWAQLLERNPEKRLTTLRETEYQPEVVRARLREDGSALSVAFQDQVLRDAGLKDDSYGEAKRFFELTDGQLHEVICYCHLGETVSAGTAARHVRVVMTGKRPGMFARMHEAFVW
jgi:hypothetical protein